MWSKLRKRLSDSGGSMRESLLNFTDIGSISDENIPQEILNADEGMGSDVPYTVTPLTSNMLKFKLYYKDCDNFIDGPNVSSYRCIQNIISSINYTISSITPVLNIPQISNLSMTFRYMTNQEQNLLDTNSEFNLIDPNNLIPIIEPFNITKYIVENCKSKCINILLIRNDDDISKMKKTDITFYLEENNKIINANDYDEVNILRDQIIHHFDVHKIPLIISNGEKTYCLVNINDTHVLLIDPTMTENTCLRWEENDFFFDTHTIWMILSIVPSDELKRQNISPIIVMD